MLPVSPSQFISQWKLYSSEQLERYTPAQLSAQNLKQSTIDFLVQAGLPTSADAFLSFTENDSEGRIANLHDDEGLPRDYKDYKIIGSDSRSNFICIDTAADDRIIFVTENNEIEEFFANTSVAHLAAFLLRFAQFSKHIADTYDAANYFEADFSKEDHDKLRSDLMQIDPAALEENTFWSFELITMLSNCSWNYIDQ